MTGDITAPQLGIDADALAGLDDVTEVWHLAAIYDLTVDEAIARRVNVDGTAQVLDFCRSRPEFERLQYVSTCYVSGDFAGDYPEDVLDAGQHFRNHYESTKFAAEMLVREAIADGLPATIYRPGIVVGDSSTGATQKYDGPYFLASFLRRQPPVAIVPAVGDADTVKVCLVPRDFVVSAMDELSVLPESIGRTYLCAHRPEPAVRARTRRRLRGPPRQEGDLGAGAAWSGAGVDEQRAGVGATAGYPGRGAGLLRVIDDLLHHQHRAGPRTDGPAVPELRRLRRHPARLHDRPSRDRFLGDGVSDNKG